MASTRTWTNTSLPLLRHHRVRLSQTVGACERARLRLGASVCARSRRWRSRLGDRGNRSYGAGLARYSSAVATVLETSRVPQSERRLRGKDDSLDAVRAARAALASETLALPRGGEQREALRLLLVARRSAVDVRREALGQLRGVIVTAPDSLREELRTLPIGKLLARCSRLRRSSAMSTDEVAVRLVLRSLARRIEAATSRPQSSSASCSATCTHSHRGCSTNPGRRSLLRNCSSPGHTAAVSLRSLLRPARRRRTSPSLERKDNTAPTQPRRRPSTQPRPPHHRPTPPPTRPGNPRLHRTPRRRGQNPPRRNTPTQALPRPPPLPTTRTTAADHDLTSHRSIIRELAQTTLLQTAASGVLTVAGRAVTPCGTRFVNGLMAGAKDRWAVWLAERRFGGDAEDRRRVLEDLQHAATRRSTSPGSLMVTRCSMSVAARG